MPIAPTPHTPLPAAPSTDDLPNFDSEGDALIAALEPMLDEIDAIAANAYNNALEAASVAAPVLMTFDAATTLADPGAGKIRLSTGTLSLVGSIAIDLQDSAGNDITNWLAEMIASTSPLKGYLTLRQGLSGKYAIYAVTAMASPSGYRQFTVSFIAGSSGGFTDGAQVAVGFARTGNVGTMAMSYIAISASAGLISGYAGCFLDITSGSGGLNSQNAATLGAGFFAFVRNSTSGVLIQGFTADAAGLFPSLRPGDVMLVHSDGSQIRHVFVRKANWRLWSTTTVGSPVASVAFTSLPQQARNLALEVKGASHNNGSNTTLGFSFSNDGSSYVGPYLPSDSIAAAGTVSGKVVVKHYVSPNWIAVGGAFSAAQAGAVQVIPNSAALTAIRAQFGAGSIDAGTFELWIED